MLGTLKISSAKIRQANKITSEPLVTIKKGAKVIVLSEGKTWDKVQYKEFVGYLKKSWLNIGRTKTEITTKMTSSRVNELLANGGYFLIRKGTYTIATTWVLHSNTVIECEPGVVLKQSGGNPIVQTYVTSQTKGYGGVYNVSWTGGTFIGNVKGISKNLFNVIHADGVKIIAATFNNCVHLHCIEIHASRAVTVDGCFFNDHIDQKGKEYKEAIQIDFAFSEGLGYASKGAATYDDTHCSKIEVLNSKFTNCTCCIGTHTQTATTNYHDNIKIIGNTATGNGSVNGYGMFVRLINMRNVEITNNRIDNFVYGVFLKDAANGYTIKGVTMPPKSTVGCMNVSIHDNIINKTIRDDAYADAIYTTSKRKVHHQNVEIWGNEFYGTGENYDIKLAWVDGATICGNRYSREKNHTKCTSCLDICQGMQA